MDAHCTSCNEAMESVFKENFGESFWCVKCGVSVEVSFDKNLISVKSKQEGK